MADTVTRGVLPSSSLSLGQTLAFRKEKEKGSRESFLHDPTFQSGEEAEQDGTADRGEGKGHLIDIRA